MTFIFALALVIARLRPDRFERSSIPRLGFKAGFAMQWVNGKEWGFVILYMTLLLDDFGGGWLGSLWIISIVTTVCILAIITWTVAGQRMERWMTDPAIAPRLFPVLGVCSHCSGRSSLCVAPDRRSDRGSEPHGSNNAPTGTSFEDGEGTTAERADDGDPEELMTDHVRNRKTGEGDASDDGATPPRNR